MDPKLLQQIKDYLEASGLKADELRKRMDEVKASTVEFNRELINAQRHSAELNRDFNDLSSQFKNIVDDLRKWDSTSSKINKSYKTLGGLADKLKYDSEDISRLSKKDLESLDKKARVELSNLKARKAELDIKFKGMSMDGVANIATQKRNKELAKQASQYLELNQTIDKEGNLINDGNNAIKTLLTLTQERLKEEIKINQTLGITGKLVDGIVGTLGKLGIESSFFENLKEDMRETAKSGDRWAVVSTATRGIFKGIGEALKDPVTQLTILVKLANFFFKAALTANAQAVELGKSLGYGADRADAFREKLVGIERSSNSIFVTTANLTQAFGELAEATGFSYEFTADQLETQIKLTKQVGLTAEEAANVQRFSILTGKTSEQTYKSFVKGLNATANQLKVGINFKATLAEALKVSGQLSANLGNDPIRIAKAIVQAKAFGMTLEQVAKSGESLLNFETSIESELKAELLTGKQLNLERARAAALAGDQATLAEELAKNVGSAADFSKMNVLQQKALAEAVGMTADELANTLTKREQALASGKSLAQVAEEERIEALERQNIQVKFNAAVEKLQSLFGNLMAGPLGSFIDMLSGALNIVNDIGNALSFMVTPLKLIGGLYLAMNAAKKIALGYDIAMNSAARINQSVGQSIAATNVVKNQLEKQSLLTRIAGNIQLFTQLAKEHGLIGALTIQLGLNKSNSTEKSKGLLFTMREYIASKASIAGDAIKKTGLVAINALKAAGSFITDKEFITSKASIAGDAIKKTGLVVINALKAEGALFTMREYITTKAAAAWDAIRKTGLIAINALKAAGSLITKRDTIFSIAGAAMGALKAAVSGIGSLLGPFAIPIGIAAAAGVTALGYNLLKGDDVMSEGGYGKRTLLSPEGAIKLNDKDTVLAGTDLGGGTPSVGGPSIDLTPMIAAINEVKAAVDNLINRPVVLNVDGKQLGSSMVQGSYKVA